MGYASKLGRARISMRNPQAAAICDRCGFVYNRVDLRFQYDWRGNALQNLYMLVCKECYDTPQEQLRAIVVPADPMPIINPRVQDYDAASSNLRQVSGANTIDPITGIPVPGGAVRSTQTGDARSTQQTGFANGSLNPLPGTDPNAPGDANPGLPYDNTSVPIAWDTDSGIIFTLATFSLSLNAWASFLAASPPGAGGWFLDGGFIARSPGPYLPYAPTFGTGAIQSMLSTALASMLPFSPLGGGCYLNQDFLAFGTGGPFSPSPNLPLNYVWQIMETWAANAPVTPQSGQAYFNDNSNGAGGGFVVLG